MLGNGVIGIQRETCNKWERRAPLTPFQCAQLLHGTQKNDKIRQILVQPCTRRVYHDQQYQNVGCKISEDLSGCGLILGVKRPEPEAMIPERAYAFFSHTHKAQPQNMPLLDEVLTKNVTLYDYELIAGENGRRLVAFGEFAGRAGMIDFLRGLGERYLSLGFSTPFLSLGSSYMYTSLSAAKAAVLAVSDEISTSGLPPTLCPMVFVFTGTGNVSRGAQEIFRLLPHSFVNPSDLPHLTSEDDLGTRNSRKFQVFGCVVNSSHMVAPNDSEKAFDKADYYAHSEEYHSVFHEKIAPYASGIVNCMYWERRYPRLLTNEQLQHLTSKQGDKQNGALQSRLIGIADITCDLKGSIECMENITTIEKPFFRYNPLSGSYHDDMNGEGVIVLAVDNLPSEFPKEASNHFGSALFPFLYNMAINNHLDNLLIPIKRACIAHRGHLTPLYEYISRMRQSTSNDIADQGLAQDSVKKFTTLVSLSGHLFDKFLINEALDVIEKAGGFFHLATCQLGQTVDAPSFAEIEVSADKEETLAHILDLLAEVANRDEKFRPKRLSSINIGKSSEMPEIQTEDQRYMPRVLILGAGRVCEPTVKYLALNGIAVPDSLQQKVSSPISSEQTYTRIHITLASLFLEDSEKVVEGIPNADAICLDVENDHDLDVNIKKASLVVSLLPPVFHARVAKSCIKMHKHLVTASYVAKEIEDLDDMAKQANISILCEMGLDPGIDHMMAMKMIDEAHAKGGTINSFQSFCGGLPSPTAASNPLGYKFSWNPAGALKACLNPAIYKLKGKTVEIHGEDILSTASPIRLPNLPAFALERIPNRDSLKYGNLYGISEEASTIFRATLRYEGYSEIMDFLVRLGFFNMESDSSLQCNVRSDVHRPTYKGFLRSLLLNYLREPGPMSTVSDKGLEQLDFKELLEVITIWSFHEDSDKAKRALACISYLGLDLDQCIPESCKTAFDVLCNRMEEKLAFAPNEQDIVLLHHEVEVSYGDGRLAEKHLGTLVELGDSVQQGDGVLQKPDSAMAKTVGWTAAIGAWLLLAGDIKQRGVLRPFHPEIYIPVLEALQAYGMQIKETVEYI